MARKHTNETTDTNETTTTFDHHNEAVESTTGAPETDVIVEEGDEEGKPKSRMLTRLESVAKVARVLAKLDEADRVAVLAMLGEAVGR